MQFLTVNLNAVLFFIRSASFLGKGNHPTFMCVAIAVPVEITH